MVFPAIFCRSLAYRSPETNSDSANFCRTIARLKASDGQSGGKTPRIRQGRHTEPSASYCNYQEPPNMRAPTTFQDDGLIYCGSYPLKGFYGRSSAHSPPVVAGSPGVRCFSLLHLTLPSRILSFFGFNLLSPHGISPSIGRRPGRKRI